MSVTCIHRQALFFIFMLLCIIQNADAVYFRHIGVKDGLTQASVMSIYQDELGRMWFGTREGFSLYDGQEIIAFKHLEDNLLLEKILIGNEICPIVGDQKGNVFLCSETRLIHYDMAKERFRCLKSENVSAVYCKDSLVLVAAADTIYSWDSKNEKFNFITNTNSPNNRIYKLFIDSKKQLWIGTRYGVFLYTPDGEMRKIVENEYVYEIIEDVKSNIWGATRGDGLYLLGNNGILSKVKHHPDNPNTLPHNDVRSITEDNYGNLWIGTFAGLCKYNPATGKYTSYQKDVLPGSLHHSSVFSTYKDKQGTIWAGTYYGGVHYFNPETDHFTFYSADIRRKDCLSFFFVGKMVEDKDNNLWICTEGGGLNYLDRKTKTFRHYISDKTKHTIAHNNVKGIRYSPIHNKMFIWTYTGGISIYDIKNDTFHNFRDERPDIYKKTGEVIHIELYEADTLIMQCRNGLFLFNIITGQLSRLFGDILQASGYLFHIDSNDHFWLIGSSAIKKINMKENRVVQTFDKQEHGFISFGISCVFEDNKGRLFFGTQGDGLYQYDSANDRFIHYTAEENKLLSNYCYEITQSEQNELIISGDKGLTFFDVDNQNVKEIRLDVLLFSGINYGCGLYICSNGEIFVGGIDGMISFFEEEIFNPNKDYELYFSSLSVNEIRIYPNDKTKILKETLSFTRKIILNHKQNNFNISFASNDYIRMHTPGQYEYKLDGFDNMWISGNEIRYTNIRPGNYKLMVREKFTENRSTPRMISLDIVVRHAWYATPFAYIIYFILISVLFYSFLRFRRIRKQLKMSLETERKKKEQIETLNKAKLQFFANISHEFRTPLTLIIVQIERLLNSNAVSPFAINKLLKMNKQAAYLRNLISELLDFRKLEQGHLKLKVRKLNIVTFLKEIYFSFHELSSMHHIAYTFDAPEDEEIHGWFDPIQLQKAFYNLISNAFKYTKPNGVIEISVKEENNTIIIKIIDSGIGISKEDIDHIFNRFYQIDNSPHNLHKVPGTGIGLSLVKGIIELHHGSITVESKPSYGSIFIVTLQKGNSHFNPDEIAELSGDDIFISQNIVTEEMSEWRATNMDKQDEDTEVPVGNNPEENEPDRKKGTVLLVEDNDELLQILRDILNPIYITLLAHNGKEGLDIARKEKPDLIVSDIIMPEMSGTEMCVAIKNDFEICHIPVILLTALSSVEHTIQGLQHGADDYISKPFNEKILLTRCNNLIQSRLIIKNKFSQNLEFDARSVSNNPIDQKFLDTINLIIEHHFENPDFNINMLASELNISRTSLYSKFESLTGMKPNDYVSQRKLKKALELLRHNFDFNIADISDMLGFGSPRYFSRYFKKQMGMSPAEYRKSLKS